MENARCVNTKLCVVLPPKRVRSVSLWGGYTSVLEFLMSLYLCIYVTQIDNQEISQTHKQEDSWEQDPRCRSPELGKQMTDFNSKRVSGRQWKPELGYRRSEELVEKAEHQVLKEPLRELCLLASSLLCPCSQD